MRYCEELEIPLLMDSHAHFKHIFDNTATLTQKNDTFSTTTYFTIIVLPLCPTELVRPDIGCYVSTDEIPADHQHMFFTLEDKSNYWYRNPRANPWNLFKKGLEKELGQCTILLRGQLLLESGKTSRENSHVESSSAKLRSKESYGQS
ncbi:hypothetical protein JTB14_021241 [Gonioctena quinquepunctata]|nr:hypothetical protein JTB14_021241 [Gonioctena quinquepunctata]